jgi:hypothetical protein
MENDDLYDIVFDIAFLANAVSAQMQILGEAKDNEFFTIEHIELDEDNNGEAKINIIARKYEIVPN